MIRFTLDNKKFDVNRFNLFIKILLHCYMINFVLVFESKTKFGG